MIDSYTKTPRPLRDVDVESSINQSKCANCTDKPCLESCPIGAIYVDPNDGFTKIKSTCFGCVLCRNACPYDAIHMDVDIAEPIKENVPNINTKLCKSCGACVQACKTGSIKIHAVDTGEAYSVINPDTCVRCGYCFRVCPTDAIKYGQLLPKTVKGGKVIIVNQDVCIGCMTCTRVCPAAGAINVSKTNKLPYINPGYCARCEECMHSCPSTAIKYSSRKKAFKLYSEIKSYDMVSEIVDKDMKRLSIDLIGLNGSLKKISKTLSLEFDDADYEGYIQYNVNDMMNRELNLSLGENIEIKKFGKLFESYLINRGIEVFDKKCIACGECLNSCPTGAISLDAPKPIVIDENKCVYCGRCVGDCQFGAIRAYDDYFHSKGCDLFFSRSDLKGQREADFSLASEKCQSCGICVKNCPTDALILEGDKVTFNEENCIYCRQCEAICPVTAIKLVNFR